MEQRELGMEEIMRRLRPLYTSLNLKNVLRIPSRAIDEEDMPCVLVMEGDDSVSKRASTDYLGYPCKRILNVTIECWDYSNGDVKNIYEETRKAVLAEKGILLQKVIIRESMAVGPYNFGIPNVLGMRVVFEMSYSDRGPF